LSIVYRGIDVSGQVFTCYRHPGRETGVRCQRCERPVCPECMVPAPVGVQCVDCVRGARSRVISGRRLLIGGSPYVTYALIAANVGVWAAGVAPALVGGGAAGIAGGGSLIGVGGLSGPDVAAGQWWRLITAGFLHSGLLHLGFNMVALFVLGPPLEGRLGRWRFVVLYLTSLLAGSFGALLVSPRQLTVGASGAIFGLLGAIIVGQRAAGISARASGMIPLLVVNLVFTIAVPGISIGGHLGGLAGGFVCGAILFNRQLQGRNGVYALAGCVGLGAACFAAALGVAAHPLFGPT
jgi:membrane associated rhomboid family serine protease